MSNWRFFHSSLKPKGQHWSWPFVSVGGGIQPRIGTVLTPATERLLAQHSS